ncbi:MAG: putative zinc protease PmbA, partial [Deltaproteobacteria bacterium]|nr:putative zinc protease PmbA [Deltaproteobacteria bacterium]
MFGYTYDRDDPAGKLIANTKAIIPVMEIDEDMIFTGPYGDYPSGELWDRSGLAVHDERKRSVLLEMEEVIRKYDSRIKVVRNCEFQEVNLEASILNSNGLTIHGQSSLFVYSAMAEAAEGDDEVSWYDWQWSHTFEGLSAKKMAMAIADKVISMLNARQIPTGTYDGIITPRAASDLLGILSESCLGESLFKDKTQLKGKEGERCFADGLTIIDSGMAGTDAFMFDGEGVPSRDNIVVEGGVFKTFLYDAYFGRKLGKNSTGNSVRSSLKSPPKCGPRGMYVQPGTRDIMPAMSTGIIIEELMGTHTANVITGDFSLGCLGYTVEKGVRTPFQGVMISGNVFDIFKNIKEAGNDLAFYGSLGS